MGKPIVSDHGGRNYGRAAVTSVSKSTTKSLRCDSCQKLRFVTPRELTRAARPRCLGCGGMLIEIEASTRRELGGKLVRRAAAKANETSLKEIREALKCWACGFIGTGTHTGLAYHLHSRQDCRREYIADKKLTAGKYIARCAFVEKEGNRSLVKMVAAESGELETVESFPKYKAAEANKLVRELNGET